MFKIKCEERGRGWRGAGGIREGFSEEEAFDLRCEGKLAFHRGVKLEEAFLGR